MKYHTTKTGEKIKVKDMTDSHLINTINYLKKRLMDVPLEAFYTGNSDYAEDAVASENAHNRTTEENIRGALYRLKKELKRRREI